MDEEKTLLAQAEARLRQSEDRWMPTHTNFLDPHQQSLVRRSLLRTPPLVTASFYGGYEGAERTVLFCCPEGMEEARDELLTVVRADHSERARAGRSGRALGHGDYLGALLGLGVRRDVIGDILVRPDGADILLLSSIAPLILNEFVQAGRVNLSVSEVPLSDLRVPDMAMKEERVTAASLRLDAVLAACFRLSRGQAQEAVRSGLVFVDHLEVLKADAPVGGGSELVLRHRGRARIIEVGGTTRKGRVVLTIQRQGK